MTSLDSSGSVRLQTGILRVETPLGVLHLISCGIRGQVTDPCLKSHCVRPVARLSGVLQADVRQPRTCRAPQELDQSSTDFVLFRVVVFERVSFPSPFFLFSKSDNSSFSDRTSSNLSKSSPCRCWSASSLCSICTAASPSRRSPTLLWLAQFASIWFRQFDSPSWILEKPKLATLFRHLTGKSSFMNDV